MGQTPAPQGKASQPTFTQEGFKAQVDKAVAEETKRRAATPALKLQAEDGGKICGATPEIMLQAREFAAALRAHTRAVDLVARYGGEEFVVLMPGCAAGAAALLLERVRASIAGVPLGSRRIALTFSAGVAELAARPTRTATST